MHETSHIELSRSALKKNLRFLKRHLGKEQIFSSVIKGNAYGHGIGYFVPMAEKSGVRHFSVFSGDEALAASKIVEHGSKILIMGHLDDHAVPWAVENDISFYIFDNRRLKAAVKAAEKLGRKAKIHLELETGLNRTGLTGTGLNRALKTIGENSEHLCLEGVCTHFAGAESLSNFWRIQKQVTAFKEGSLRVKSEVPTVERDGTMFHTACSAAALIYPETILNMARFGIAQYGFWPSKETEIHYMAQKDHGHRRRRKKDPLIRVLKWVSRVMSTKKVKRGDYVGYGSSSLVTRDLKLASVPVGYFHGFSRDLSNRGQVLVHGKRAPVVGMVNMNMIMVDVTGDTWSEKGDEVVIIGKQGENTISVGSFGELTRFINYELLVSLPSEIPRIIVD